MTDTLTPLQQAAQLVNDAELEGAKQLLAVFNRLETDLAAIDAALQFPSGLRSETKRIISEMRSQTTYRRTTELPNLIQQLDPPVATTMAP